MSKGKWAFKPADIKRAIQTAQKAGLTVSGFRISPQGEIYIETLKPQAQGSASEWQDAIAKLEARQ